MSVHVLSWAWQQDVGDAGAKLILLKLADQANDLGEAWPSKRTMARDCEMSERSVQRKIGALVELGLISSEERVVEGRQTSNLYRMVRGDRLSPPGRQTVPGGATTVSPQEPSFEPSSLLKERARALHDSIYQALVAACYRPGATLTDREKRQVALAAGNIASAGATADQVPMVKAAYLAHSSYGKCALTAQALSSRWAELAPAATSAACPDCGIRGGRHAEGCERLST